MLKNRTPLPLLGSPGNSLSHLFEGGLKGSFKQDDTVVLILLSLRVGH